MLNDEDEATQPGWQVHTLTRQGTDYLVDSRDYFINFEILVSEEYLEVVPSSASPDNVPPWSNRTLIGPYSWFVNEKGIVDSLLFSFPTTENVGFQDVFPSQKQPEAVETSTISGAMGVAEGTEYTLNLQSSETRPTPTSWEINWGEGNIEDLDGNPSSAVHTYADGPNVFPIVAKTTDEEGTLTSNLVTVTVTNVAPSIALSGSSTINAGLPYTLSFGQVTDPGSDTVGAYNVRWGDGESDSYSVASPATHVYDNPGAVSITVDLVDEDGTHPFAGSHSVSVVDVPPTVTLTGADSVNEGEVYSLTLDPGNQSFIEFVVHWGDDATNSYTTAGAKNHIYNDGGVDVGITVDMVTASGTIVGVASKTVTVNNVASSISPTGPGTALEGTEYTLTLGPISDTGGNNVTQVIVNWGDGQSDTFETPFPDEALHTYINGPATRTITVDLVDDDGTNNAASLQVSVQDVAPTVGFSGATSVDEGSHYTITVGPVFDPGADVLTQLIIHWGDGSPNLFSQAPGDVTHTYADGTTNPVITVDVLDDDGLHENAGSFSLTVNDVAPTLALAGPLEVDEGSPYTLTLGNVVDPGDDTVTAYLIDWDDGTTPQNIAAGSLPSSREVTHTYANGPATPTIRVDLFDEEVQPHVGAGSHSLTVNDVAPTVFLSGPESTDEGSPYTLTLGDVTDPGTDGVIEYIVHWGDDSPAQSFFNAGAVTHTYADGIANPTITVDLRDEDGTHTGAGILLLAVNNVAPTADAGGPYTGVGGIPITFNGSATDPSVPDTLEGFLFQWDFEYDGTTFNASQGGIGLTSPVHTYLSAGTFTLALQVTDKDGGVSDIDTASVTVAPPPTSVLYVVDNSRGGSPDGEVWKYDAFTGLQETVDLPNVNGASAGITTDGASFWTVDQGDEVAYKYSSSFTRDSAGDIPLHDDNDEPEGITVFGNFAWVVDDDENKVFRYELTNPASVESWDLAGSNNSPRGITTNGAFIFVVDKDDKFVYQYSMSGAVVTNGGFNLKSGSGNTDGITTGGGFIWVLSRSHEEVRKYDMSGNHLPSGRIVLENDNNQAQGITVRPR